MGSVLLWTVLWLVGAAAAELDAGTAQLLLSGLLGSLPSGDVVPELQPSAELRTQHVRSLARTMNQSLWMTPLRNRELGISYMGSQERLRVAVSKLMSGQKFTLSTLGGSVTEGHGGTPEAPSWPVQLYELLNATFHNPNSRLVNGARGATGTTYMSLCLDEHLSPDTDILFVEYAINDAFRTANPINNVPRRCMERLLRKALNYPNKPAVVIFNYWSPWLGEKPGSFWENAEADFSEFSHYYHLPTLSLKGGLFPLFRAGIPPFKIDKREATMQQFFIDSYHPWGPTGHRIMAEMAVHLVIKAAYGLLAQPLTRRELDIARSHLPPPMAPNNWETAGNTCAFQERFKQLVVSSQGWDFVNEQSNQGRTKWGYITTTVGAQLRFKISTKPGFNHSGNVLLHLAMLRSYEHMGTATIACESGCTCGTTTFNGHHKDKTSPVAIHAFSVSQHPECVVVVSNVQETSSGEHKVKVVGVSMSEDPEHTSGPEGYALEYLTDVGLAARVNVDGWGKGVRPMAAVEATRGAGPAAGRRSAHTHLA